MSLTAPPPARQPVAPAAPPDAPGAPAVSVAPHVKPAQPHGPAAPPERRLEIPPYDLGAAVHLRRELGLSHGLAQILVRRGLEDPEAARAFLSASECHPLEAFAGLADAAAVVRSHVERGSRIVVHGDYDVDGVCATALLITALRRLGGTPSSYIPSRTEDGYGLALKTVERLAARGTDLIITVDCGITAVEEVSAARAAGIEVVLTDHHSPSADGRLPDAHIVHPGICGYPFPELCGTAVAFKLAEALGAADAEADLELVAMATVADLMPLRGENRRLVREGLAALARTARPGLRSLMAVSRADPSELNAGTVGFRLAPRINASGRLRRADAALELLLTEDARRAGEIAAELDALNAERREVEQRILWEAEAQVRELGSRPAYVLAAEGWHPGVIGIVASRIVERYHRPTLLVAIGEDGTGQGSGRSIPGFDLLGALHAVSRHLDRYGGHRMAAGLSVRAEAIEQLRSDLEAHALSVLDEDLLRPVDRVDVVASGTDLGLAFAEELEVLEPCGLGNPAPRLLVAGARFEDVRTMGDGRHARFAVVSGGTSSRAVSFGCEGQLGVDPGEAVDASFRLERNSWNGAVEPRLVLRAVHRRERRPIEVLGEPAEFLAGVLDELAASACPEPVESQAQARDVLDRRGESPLAILADAVSAGGEVLALCADVSRRLPGLTERSGGFTLLAHHALERDPVLAEPFRQIVVLDPPCSEFGASLLRLGDGYTHMAWGKAELGFTRNMHDLEYSLRDSLAALYRALMAARGTPATGGAAPGLEQLLRGAGGHGRPARLAARLVRVLSELGLVEVDRDAPSITITRAARTDLDRSPSYRAYTRRHEEGLQCLARAGLPELG